MFLRGMDSYESLVSRISSSSGVEVDELERKVEAKRAKLSGLVSKEGAAQIVAAELGVNLDKEKLKIAELVHGMRRTNVLGQVIEIFPIREFNKNGRQGKVGSFMLADDSSNIKVVLWDTNHIDLIERGKLKKGDVIEVSNGGVRNRELHLGSFSDIKASKEKIEGKIVTEKVYGSKKLKDVKPGDSLTIRAFIVQSFEPRYFEVCPECGKKVVEGKCVKHDKVVGKKRALLNIFLDDGSEVIRSVLFGENINKLGLSDEEIFDLEKFASKKNELLGEEKVYSGNVRANALYNTTELILEDVEDIKVDELVKELEAKAQG